MVPNDLMVMTVTCFFFNKLGMKICEIRTHSFLIGLKCIGCLCGYGCSVSLISP